MEKEFLCPICKIPIPLQHSDYDWRPDGSGGGIKEGPEYWAGCCCICRFYTGKLTESHWKTK